MDAFTLVAKLILDKSEFDAGLAQAEASATKGGSGGGLTKWGVAAGHAIGTAATKAVSAAFRAGKDAVQTSANFEAAMSRVKTIGQLTEDEFTQVRQTAIDLGESTVFTAEQVADAFRYMAIAGWKSEKMLGGIAGVLDLAASTGTDLARSSDIVTDAMTAMHIPVDASGESVSHFSDVLAAAASNSNTTVEQMGDAFKYLATTGGVLGYTVEDVSYALGLLANAGIKGSMAGTSMRQVLNTLINPTEDAADAMEKLGVSLFEPGTDKRKPLAQVITELQESFKNANFNLEGFDRNQIRENAEKLEQWYNESLDEINRKDAEGWYTKKQYDYEIKKLENEFSDKFLRTVMPNEWMLRQLGNIGGLRGISSLLALMTAEAEDAGQLFDAIANSEGAAGEMSESMLDNLLGDITLLNSALDGLKILASGEYTEPIRQFIQTITEEVGKLSKAFEEGGLAGMFNNLAQWIIDGITDTLKSADFAKGAGQFGKALGDFVGNLVQSLVSSGSELMSGLFDAGMNLAGGLISGLFSGLFGTGDDSLGYFMNKAQEDQQEAIDKANATAVEAQGIVGYLQSLVDQYGEAAAKTNEWADAMARLQSLIPGVSDAMKQENQTMGEMLDNMSQYIDQMRQQAVQEARQQTLQSYQDKYVQGEIALAQNQEAYNQAQSTMAAARQAAYDLMKQAAETGYNDGSGYLFPQMFNGDNARFQSADDINLGDTWTRAALGEAIDALTNAGQNEGGYSTGGILDAYDNAAAAAETSAGNMEQLANDAASLKTQMKIAEDALGNMSDSVEDTADETEDLNGIADGAGDLDLSGLQGAASSAESSLNGVAASANVDFGAVNSANGNLASAFNSLAARANSVSFAGIGGGALGGGGGSAPTVVAFGSHAKGAWEIPYDEYPAMLHRGEMVLTASQARRYRNGDAGDLSADAMYQAVAEAVQKAVASIQINMDGAAVGNAVTKQVSRNIYKDQYGRRFATV